MFLLGVYGTDLIRMDCYDFYCPESSKGLKFEPLNHQKQTWGLKFDTLGGSRVEHYTYTYPPKKNDSIAPEK